MKKNLILVGMLLLASLPSLASVDVTTYTQPYYLNNSNYSSEANRLIQLSKHYANAVPVKETKKVYSDNKFLNATGEAIDAAFKYIDPAWDDERFFRRDLPQSFGFEDL